MKIHQLAQRMVRPVYREFGFDLDVERLLKDEGYCCALWDLIADSKSSELRAAAAEAKVRLNELWGNDVAIPNQYSASVR